MGCGPCKKKPPPEAESADAGHVAEPAPRKREDARKGPAEGRAKIDREAVDAILKHLGASTEQQTFYWHWHQVTLDVAARDPGHTNELRVCADGSSLEHTLAASYDLVLDVADKLVKGSSAGGGLELSDGPTGHHGNKLRHLVKAMQTRPDRVALWCRIKRIGTKLPAIDAGFTMLGPVRWVELDMLMPPCEDHEVLRDFAMEHNWVARDFGCSFFPTEPEHRVTFEVSPANPKKGRELVNSFFFFKALGFVITPQSVVVAVSGCEPNNFAVQACLGPRGLTRLNIQLLWPRTNIWRAVCDGARITPKAEAVDHATRQLAVPPVHVEYGADAAGYVCTLGWTNVHQDDLSR